jgi:hypothetical protein
MLRLPTPRRGWLGSFSCCAPAGSTNPKDYRSLFYAARVAARIGTGIYHIGSLQELPHTVCDPMVPFSVTFNATW